MHWTLINVVSFHAATLENIPKGMCIEVTNEVVIGLYYKWCGHKESTYELLSEEGYAFIYSNWVVDSKFTMVQANHKLLKGLGKLVTHPQAP